MEDSKIFISKTPLRLSFSGGGTDMPYFYKKYGGLTVSATIKKYIYVLVRTHNNFQEKYRLNYSITENVNSIEKIKNIRVKLVLKKLKIKSPLFISTFSDIPANTGLGSSSAFTIGLITALLKITKKKMSKSQIAEEAYNIEKKITKNSIGKQDHYIASHGGFLITRYGKKRVSVKKLKISKKNKKKLFENCYMLWTGVTRQASYILEDQQKNYNHNINHLRKLNTVTNKLISHLESKNLSLKQVSAQINLNWKLKKEFSRHITNNKIDSIYLDLLKLGAFGGKLLGAGSGGFIFFIIEKKKISKIKRHFKNFKIFKIENSSSGSEII